MNERSKEVETIVDRILAEPSQRSRILTEACGEDTVLREEVTSLLHHCEEAALDASPEAPATELVAAAVRSHTGRSVAAPSDPQRIGEFRIVARLGAGGMGVVYLAEQEHPRRTVALKVIRPGVATPAILQRFAREGEALARLQHPGIAQVFATGTADTGLGPQPFIAMEFVDGKPLTAFCDEHQLSVRERLELLIQVCHAVTHAHQKSLIHRDLKPSNILAATQDGKHVVKVIDFGIAKAVDDDALKAEQVTEERQLIGTPEYMSPEQAEGSLDIDTTTDVYALGVVLYQLLTGSTPFSGKELRAATPAERQRIICEVEPAKPSTRLSQQDETLVGLATKRHCEPSKLANIVHGDLDWIVMKALEKERARRYESASALATDVQRHLSGEAVLAAPPGAAYRMKKFVRRHRHAVVAACLIAIALVLGTIATTWQAHAANTARKDSDQVAGFLEELIRVEPLSADGTLHHVDNGTAYGEIVSKWVRQVRAKSAAELPDQARVRVLRILALASSQMGDPVQAMELDQETLGLQEKLFGPASLEVAETLLRSSAGLPFIGRTPLADKYATRALQLLEARLGARDPRTTAARINLAAIWTMEGRVAEVDPILEGEVATLRAAHPTESTNLIQALHAAGDVRVLQGRFRDAAALADEALALAVGQFGGNSLIANQQRQVLWRASIGADDDGRAEALSRERIDFATSYWGTDHLEMMTVLIDSAELASRHRDFDQAERLCRQALEIGRKRASPSHRYLLASLTGLAQVLLTKGEYDEAEKLLREAIAASGDYSASLDVANTLLASTLYCKGDTNGAKTQVLACLGRTAGTRAVAATLQPRAWSLLGSILIDAGELDEAALELRGALTGVATIPGDQQVANGELKCLLGIALYEKHEFQPAKQWLGESVDLWRDHQSTWSPVVLCPLCAFGRVLVDLGDAHTAQASLSQAVELYHQNPLAHAWLTAEAESALGNCQANIEDYGGSENLLLKSYLVIESRYGVHHRYTQRAVTRIVELYEAWHDTADAGRDHAVEAANWRVKLEAPSDH